MRASDSCCLSSLILLSDYAIVGGSHGVALSSPPRMGLAEAQVSLRILIDEDLLIREDDCPLLSLL